MISISIKIDASIKHACINCQSYLVLKSINKQAIYKIPKEVFVGFQKGMLIIRTFPENENIVRTLKKEIENFDTSKMFRRILRLRGLGYRILASSDAENFEIRLGFSRKIVLPKVHSTYIARFKKQQLIFEGHNSVSLSNFVHKIKRLRSINVYNGKGLYQKREILLLKDFKK